MALLIALANRPTIGRNQVWGVIALNLAWIAGSMVLLFGDWVESNALGYTFMLAQAVAVAVFATVQIACLVEEEARTWGSTARL